ncbi:hypothetical protein NDU88_007083 [Pleurodeles waltl]|uniref:Uncharacterized protein n=1 Tax=Pleurodeles waltl TaxID=8319 RepID=A0AAV7PKA9_PLEWA|nr:hypothetical protein NDU88_007083 [Pleurodeles waltl]
MTQELRKFTWESQSSPSLQQPLLSCLGSILLQLRWGSLRLGALGRWMMHCDLPPQQLGGERALGVRCVRRVLLDPATSQDTKGLRLPVSITKHPELRMFYARFAKAAPSVNYGLALLSSVK